MMNIAKIGSLAAAAVLALGTVVSAATTTIVASAPASWALVDMNATTTVNGTWTTAAAIISGSVKAQYKSPFDPIKADNGADVTGGDVIPGWETIDYFTVGSPGKQASPAVMTFSAVQSYLTLLWGSIDSYNAIAFYRNGVAGDIVDGSYLLANGATPVASGAAFVTIATSFDEIRFFSNYANGGVDRPAFEFSNVVAAVLVPDVQAAVPLPGAGLLLVGALGALAALRRRRAMAS